MKFDSIAHQERYFDAMKEVERIEAKIRECDEADKGHGSWDQALKSAKAKFRAEGGDC